MNNINQLVFIMDVGSVLFEVGNRAVFCVKFKIWIKIPFRTNCVGRVTAGFCGAVLFCQLYDAVQVKYRVSHRNMNIFKIKL